MQRNRPACDRSECGSLRAVMYRTARVRRTAIVAGALLALAAAQQMAGGLARAASKDAGGKAPGEWGALEFLGQSIPPGQAKKMPFAPMRTFASAFLDTMVLVVRGARPGPTLCVIAGIHGDELNGVEIANRVFSDTPPEKLSGTLIIIPMVNAAGIRSGLRYLPDRRDLNRCFPGNPTGSTGSRLANILFERVIRGSDALIDLHTGSGNRTNLPQIRTDMENPAALHLAESFGIGVVLHGTGPEGSLRRAALDIGIPAIIYEAGEPLRFQEEEIAEGTRGVRNVMAGLGMVQGEEKTKPRAQVYRKTRWVRAAKQGGIFLTSRALGESVSKGDLLGIVKDPMTGETEEVLAPVDGRLIGMANPQIVLPGYGLFHLGI